MPETEQWLNDLLKDLLEQGFYGKLVLEMREGLVVLVRREETIKPPVKIGSNGKTG